eukprot:CAMPEP_0202894660 /NCGR_PEP_ID=MMETSP1392-20130828/4018_1 /ASSEMBLY_ACC=CAM_ASM_000868 /TAXON_ID=225041 /ORGANISM="Chlamydomonas chlamydogama, Strain SAG 11-48b" /LENGTH=193 /DNA_ID=CAMNT_0049579419 /DNA_START=114 /DNA_END=695 /DNA_ORIENTATION=+
MKLKQKDVELLMLDLQLEQLRRERDVALLQTENEVLKKEKVMQEEKGLMIEKVKGQLWRMKEANNALMSSYGLLNVRSAFEVAYEYARRICKLPRGESGEVVWETLLERTPELLHCLETKTNWGSDTKDVAKKLTQIYSVLPTIMHSAYIASPTHVVIKESTVGKENAAALQCVFEEFDIPCEKVAMEQDEGV